MFSCEENAKRGPLTIEFDKRTTHITDSRNKNEAIFILQYAFLKIGLAYLKYLP